MHKAILVSLAVIAGACGPADAKGPFYAFNVGNWNGGTYSDDNSGEFSHCAAYARYNSGINLFVAVTKTYQWNIGFSHPNWHLIDGNKINARLIFDGARYLDVQATAKGANLAVVSLPTTSQMVNAFRGSSLMEVVFSSGRASFRLDQTSRLIPDLVDCVRAGPQTVATSLPSTAQPPSPKAPTAPAQSPASPSKEAVAEREKLLNAAAADYQKCLAFQMREIVPYSNEGAETLAQVIVTKCQDVEQKFTSLAVAIYGTSRADMERAVSESVEKQKRSMVADIVTLRAELAKALLNAPKEKKEAVDKGI